MIEFLCMCFIEFVFRSRSCACAVIDFMDMCMHTGPVYGGSVYTALAAGKDWTLADF